MPQLRKYIRVWSDPQGKGPSFCNPIEEFGILADTCDGSESGEQLLIEYIEMPKEEYEALPEFTGFYLLKLSI